MTTALYAVDPIVTEAEYRKLRKQLDEYERWVSASRQLDDWASYRPQGVPPHVRWVSMRDRSRVEVWEFLHYPPQEYYLYIDEVNCLAQTWMDDKLGDVEFGREWRDNFGGTRVSVRIRAINGCLYVGTYYKSAGGYARIRLAKHQPAPSE